MQRGRSTDAHHIEMFSLQHRWVIPVGRRRDTAIQKTATTILIRICSGCQDDIGQGQVGSRMGPDLLPPGILIEQIADLPKTDDPRSILRLREFRG